MKKHKNPLASLGLAFGLALGVSFSATAGEFDGVTLKVVLRNGKRFRPQYFSIILIGHCLLFGYALDRAKSSGLGDLAPIRRRKCKMTIYQHKEKGSKL